ncbi:sulfotransferase [Nocardioides donggukensis]|uniref:Sulfotransferase n=1 Tax=Nocardioides donggukensis TaxID=2774019 RepID=A0A927K294_9ACTN|nr:sulfotransferase [Nocardioides donggukensis]MBD8869127.1 sulfotransferase [Nocardioides donggukensis]
MPSAKGALRRLVPPIGRVVDERDALIRRTTRLRARLATSQALARRRQRRIRRLRARLERQGLKLTRVRDRLTNSELGARALQAELAAYRERDVRADGEPLAYLFVMTYGRSGSTLLQAILNSVPGVMVRGENGGLLSHLYAFHRQATDVRSNREVSSESPGHPFYGIGGYDEEEALAAIRELVTRTLLRPRPGVHTVGFKEIRWFEEDLDDYLAFLRGVFPGARFVVNTRRLEDVAKSKWWPDREDPVGELRAYEQRILAAAETLGQDAFRVRYDDYVDDPEQLRPLFAWLGAEFDADRLAEVMETRYAPHTPLPEA